MRTTDDGGGEAAGDDGRDGSAAGRGEDGALQEHDGCFEAIRAGLQRCETSPSRDL